MEVDKGEVVPAKLLSWRDKFDTRTYTREWLVQWEGMDIGDATWEEELMLKKFPDLCLEDKAVFGGGSDDRKGIWPVNKESIEPKV